MSNAVPKTRKPWDEHFMAMARLVSEQATCNRRHVGAVVTVGRRVVATGFNGSPSGMPHCEDVGCQMEDGHCVATVHAEANAIAHAAKHGVSLDGGTIYISASACWPCFKLIASAGITRAVFGEHYPDEKWIEAARGMGVIAEFASVPQSK